MSDAFIANIPEKQTINNASQVVARLRLPAGSYVVFGKALAAALKLNGTIDFNQPFECKLVCNSVEDSCLLNLYSDGSQGGNWGTFSLNIGVELPEGGQVELFCTPGNPGCILLFNVVICALAVDNLKVTTSGPPAQESTRFNPFSKVLKQSTTSDYITSH